MSRAGAVAAVALVLALGAGCSDDEPDGVADEPTTTTAEGDATTTSGDGDATTTTVPAGESCEASAPPSSEETRTEQPADVDGDGRGDAVSVFRADDGWHLRVDLDGGERGSIDEALTTVPTDDAAVETTVDLDGDGDDELWVVVGHGASTTVYGLYDLDGCDLEPVTLGGGPAEFAVGGPVLLLQGVRCEADGHVTHLGATSDDGETFTTLDLVYELQAGELVRVDDTSATMTADDPAFPAYTAFDC